MPRSCFILTVVLASTLVLSCDQTNPSEPANTLSPSYRTEQNPQGPGAFAIHIPEASFVTFDPDPAPGLTALVGATFAEHLLFCETGEPPFPMDRLLVFRPDGSIMTRVQGAQVPLVIWQTAIPGINILAEICDPAFLALPRLEGTAQFLEKDTDVLVSGNRTDAYSNKIVGQVSSDAGERFKFLGKNYIVILRNGELRQTFDLSLRHIGQ
jgi:hypothetical protein